MRSKTAFAFMIFVDTQSEEKTASMQLRILFSFTYLYKKDTDAISFMPLLDRLKNSPEATLNPKFTDM